MSVLLGASPDDAGQDALALAAVWCRTVGQRLVVAHIHLPTIEHPSRGNVDAEWEAFVWGRAREIAEAAAAEAAGAYGLADVSTAIHAHRSSGHGLSELADSVDASVIVVGSAPGGFPGRIAQGSTSDQLLHGSPVPVALAPHRYRTTHPERIGRLVVAYQRTPESDRAVRTAAALAQRHGLDLLLVTLVLRVTRIYGARVGRDAERQVLDVLVEDAREGLADAAAAAVASGVDPGAVTAAVVEGDAPAAALARLDWRDDDLLVLGSTALGPVRRVFLGDMTYKLLRASPAPALVLPRHP